MSAFVLSLCLRRVYEFNLILYQNNILSLAQIDISVTEIDKTFKIISYLHLILLNVV